MFDDSAELVAADPPFSTFGFKSFTGTTRLPLLGKTIEEHFSNFKESVSSYFNHPPFAEWDGDPQKLDSRLRAERATVDTWGENELRKIYEPQPALRSDWNMYVRQIN